MKRDALNFLRRIRLFLAIVWRPATGPSRDEPPLTPWRLWRDHSLDVRTAWDVAGVVWGPDGEVSR